MESEDNPVDESLSLGQEDQMNDLRQALEEAEVRLQKAEARNNHLLETLIATSQLQQALGFEDAKKVLKQEADSILKAKEKQTMTSNKFHCWHSSAHSTGKPFDQ